MDTTLVGIRSGNCEAPEAIAANSPSTRSASCPSSATVTRIRAASSRPARNSFSKASDWICVGALDDSCQSRSACSPALGTPPDFGEALAALQDPRHWSAARAQLFGLWGEGVDNAAVHSYINSMGEYGFDMWARAGREIARAFADVPVPLAALAELADAGIPCPTLHLYAQPRDDGYLAAQQRYAAEHPWFQVRRLDATSHFPCLEVPADITAAVEDFSRSLP